MLWLYVLLVIVHSLPTENEFRELDTKIDGDVFLPGDDGFDSKNAMWFVAFDDVPSSAIIYANNENDIVLIIQFLNDFVNIDGTKFRIRGSGSSFGGYSKCAECVIIDTRRIKGVKYIESNSDIYLSIRSGTRMSSFSSLVLSLCFLHFLSHKKSNKKANTSNY